MKCVITKASESLKEEKYEDERYIYSIEDLLSIMDEFGKRIILSKIDDGIGVLIYDGYIE